MRYAPDHNDAARTRILDAASRQFQEHGIDGVGLAKIMAEAGLTVGTFYTHFESKEALLREVLRRSLAARHEELAQGADLESVVRAYLSPEHRDARERGCPVASLASEVARRPRTTKSTLASGLDPSLEVLVDLLSKRKGKKVTRAEAGAFFGLLAGTLQLARTTPDRAESAAILDAGIRAALQLAK